VPRRIRTRSEFDADPLWPATVLELAPGKHRSCVQRRYRQFPRIQHRPAASSATLLRRAFVTGHTDKPALDTRPPDNSCTLSLFGRNERLERRKRKTNERDETAEHGPAAE